MYDCTISMTYATEKKIATLRRSDIKAKWSARRPAVCASRSNLHVGVLWPSLRSLREGYYDGTFCAHSGVIKCDIDFMRTSLNLYVCTWFIPIYIYVTFRKVVFNAQNSHTYIFSVFCAIKECLRLVT